MLLFSFEFFMQKSEVFYKSGNSYIEIYLYR